MLVSIQCLGWHDEERRLYPYPFFSWCFLLLVSLLLSLGLALSAPADRREHEDTNSQRITVAKLRARYLDFASLTTQIASADLWFQDLPLVIQST